MRRVPLVGLALVVLGGGLYCDPSCREGFIVPRLLVIALGAAVLWADLLIRAARGEAVFRWSPLDGPLLAFGAAMLITTAFSNDVWMSILGPHQGPFHGILPLTLCALIFYAVMASELEHALPAMLLAVGVIGGLHAMIQGWGLDPWFAWACPDGRMVGTFGMPIYLGAMLAAVAPIAWDLARRKNPFGGPALLILAFGFLETKARGGLAAGIGGILVYEALARRRGALALAILAAFSAVFLVLPAHSASDISRREVWVTALKVFWRYPWFGAGPDAFSLAFRRDMTADFADLNNNMFMVQINAHHDFLQIASTMGLLGLAAYAFFLKRVSHIVNQVSCWPKSNAALGGLLGALFIQAKVNDIPIWTLAAAAAALAVLGRDLRWPTGLSRRLSVPLATAGLLVSLGLTVQYARSVRAEHLSLDAESDWRVGRSIQAVKAFTAAARLQPFDFYYVDQQLGHTMGAIMSFPAPARGPLLAAVARQANIELARHPMDPGSHEAVAISLLYQALERGRLQRANDIERELRVSHELSPKFTPMAKIRQQVAGFLHRRKETT